MKLDAYSMGFSNRTWQETLEILSAFEIQRLVDIRTLPGSKHTPQFNQEHLRKALPNAGVEYIHMKSLGGLRKPLKNSTTNAGWRNDAFRGYADYMQTPEFETALNELICLLSQRTTVYTCTEAVFWRCHRQLVSDALAVRGYCSGHIFNASKVEQHKLTNFAKTDGTRVTYPTLL
ncbi:MAG: DNA repair protein [Acidobacteria bacterium]|nr:MAG: DNA repair protein [Acidobacteriota bacterium]